MSNTYDVIIIGGGPNGLTAGAYLAKAGAKVLVSERRYEIGGGLATEEEITIPGFYHNTHSIYHMMVDYAPPIPDLDLASYQVEYIWPSLQFAMPFKDGRCLCLYQDVEKTCRSFAEFSQKDADTYREFKQKLDVYMEDFLGPATYVPPIPALEQIVKLQTSELGSEIMRYSEMSPQEIIEELFENEHIKTLMLYAACHWGIGYDVNGVGYMALLLLQRATNYRLVKGGSHQIASSLYKIIMENGGMVLTSQLIKRIIVEGNRATGIEMTNGKILEAGKAVISTLDPHQTFLKLVGEDNLENDMVEKTKLWKWDKWSLLTVHLALSEPPHFKVADSDPELDKALIYLIGIETVDDLLNHWKAIEEGDMEKLATSGFLASFPSMHDPLQAPEGKCTGLISQMAPYRIKEGTTTMLRHKYKEELAAQRLAVLQEYIPNITDSVLWSYVSTPADIANKFSNMVEGSIKHGDYGPLQMGYLRPNEDCSHHRTPVEGLYVGGASSFSGALITFGPGYLVANAVAEDQGIQKWWSEPESVKKSKEKGFL
jgi:phytoene dehydrogenase-like protein